MVAVVQAGDATDMIPLLDNNGSGVYNKGRNNKLDFQKQFLGGMVTKSASNPFAWRQGIFVPTANIGHSITDGQLFQSGGGAGAQAVVVSKFRAIVTRTGVGPYLVSQESDITLPMPAADGALPRIDLLCVMAYDIGAVGSDAQHGPKFIVVTGDPNAVPVIPALPAAVADAMILGRMARPAADNTIGSGDLTQTRKGSGLHGAPRVLLEGDTLADAGMHHGEQRMRLGSAFIATDYINANYTCLVDRWDAVNATWRGTQPIHLPKPTLLTTASLGGGGTFTMAAVAIPDPGWPFRLDCSGSVLQEIVGGATTVVRDVYAQFNLDDAAFVPAPVTRIIRRGARSTANLSPAIIDAAGRYSTPLTGAHTVYFIIRNDSIPSNFITWADNAYAHCSVSILPA